MDESNDEGYPTNLTSSLPSTHLRSSAEITQPTRVIVVSREKQMNEDNSDGEDLE